MSPQNSNTDRKSFRMGNFKTTSPLRGIFWLPIFLVFIIPPFILPFLTEKDGSIIFSILFIGSLIYIFILKIFENIYRSSSYHIQKNRKEIEAIVLSKENSIVEILDMSTIIYKKISLLTRRYRFTKIMCNKAAYEIIKNLIFSTLSWIIPLLKDLQKEILDQIIMQKDIIESAKSELNTHVNGTFEFEQLSELQSARLDSQIEQFEELQKILVKI